MKKQREMVENGDDKQRIERVGKSMQDLNKENKITQQEKRSWPKEPAEYQKNAVARATQTVYTLRRARWRNP